MVSRAFQRIFLDQAPPSRLEEAHPLCKEKGKGFCGFSPLNEDFTLMQSDRQNFLKFWVPFFVSSPIKKAGQRRYSWLFLSCLPIQVMFLKA